MEECFKIADQLTAAQTSILASTDGFDFFRESYRKQSRLSHVAMLHATGDFSRIFTVDNFVNLGNLATCIDGREVVKKGIEWFQSLNEGESDSLFQSAIVLFTNNNFAELGHAAYQAMVERYPSNLYIIWDFDNHHWLQNSARAALLADLYVPAHYDNFFLISRFNAFSLEPTNIGVVQWKSDFLRQKLPDILAFERTDEPLGHHTAWNFPYRLKVLQTFATKLRHVGVASPEFNYRTPSERLAEWCSHKSHVVIPVYNDLPIRIFDALITGGIPILPRSLQGWVRLGGIAEDEAVFYDALDIVEPVNVVRKANALFDSSGKLGMMRRIEKALSMFHCDTRVGDIVKRAHVIIQNLREGRV